MKTEILNTGWNETTVNKIVITKPISTKVFSTAGEWATFTGTRPIFNKNGRNHCQCCGRKWEKSPAELKTYLLFTNKGNKIVCEHCYENFNLNP